MTNTIQIALVARTSDWVEIVNVGGGFRTVEFLEANRKHMDRVSFGHTGPQGSSHAIKADRVQRFVEFANHHGFDVAYRSHEQVWG